MKINVFSHALTYILSELPESTSAVNGLFPTETITVACFKDSGQEATIAQSEGENIEATVGTFDLKTFA